MKKFLTFALFGAFLCLCCGGCVSPRGQDAPTIFKQSPSGALEPNPKIVDLVRDTGNLFGLPGAGTAAAVIGGLHLAAYVANRRKICQTVDEAISDHEDEHHDQRDVADHIKAFVEDHETKFHDPTPPAK